MKSVIRACVVVIIACSFLWCGSNAAWADITGSISGIVTDPSGAVIPGATVVATALSTNVQRTTVTDAKGFYAFPALEPVQLGENDDRSLSGTFDDTIDEPSYANNGSHLYVDRNPRNQKPYFNPNFFQLEPLGQVGNVMRRFFPGPGILNTDVALSKNSDFGGSRVLQFRAEAFNVFNHAQFNNPSGNINNTGQGGFGYVTSARDPRIMQVALKLLF